MGFALLLCRRWQAVILLPFLLLPVRTANGIDAEPIELACLLAAADAVVEARLPEHPGDTYVATVVDVVAGNVPQKKLHVLEPAPWRGPGGAFPSNEALLFLVKRPPGRWEVLGPSGEGRVMLLGEHAYTTGISVPTAQAGRWEVRGARVEGFRTSRSMLKAALAEFSRCYRWKRKDSGVSPVLQCEQSLAAQLPSRSELHRHLYQKVQAARSEPLSCGLVLAPERPPPRE